MTMRPVTRARAAGDERGFVLLMVLLIVAALMVTASGALLVARTDLATASTSARASRAFHLAQAGMNRYVGEGIVTATPSVYTMGGGTVTVSAARLAVSPGRTVYEIAAVATVGTGTGHTARSEVRRLAGLDAPAFVRPLAPFSTTASSLTLAGSYSGADASVAGACPDSVRGTIAGLALVAGGTPNIAYAYIQGTPRTRSEASAAAMRALIAPDWLTLTSAATRFRYEVPAVSWPNFAALPASDYPTIRVRGNIRLEASHSGRGFLVVDGSVDLGTNFVWDGVIIAGDMPATVRTNATINGALLAGLAATARTTIDMRGNTTGSPRFLYDACKAYAAIRPGGEVMRMLANTWSEPRR